MSWNEPGGGNRQRDPWGGKDQGPPDLDEALKKLQEQLNGLFGGRSGGGSSKGAGSLIGIVAVIAVTVWGLMGLTQIGEQERAVVLRLGEYNRIAQPGLFWYPRGIDTISRVNITQVRSAQFRETMLTQDENIVDVSMSVQYVIDDPKNFVLEVRDPERSLQHAAQSALRHVVGDSSMGLVLTEGRAAIAVQVRERLQQYLVNYTTGINVQKVNIDDASPPSQVQEAFDDVIKAREDEERVKNEAESYANGIVPEARGRAQRIKEEAEAYRQQVIAKATGEAQRFDQVSDASGTSTPGRLIISTSACKTSRTLGQFSASPTKITFASLNSAMYWATSALSVVNRPTLTLPEAMIERSAKNQCARLCERRRILVSLA